MKINDLMAIDITYAEVENRIDSIKRKKNKYGFCHIVVRLIILFSGAFITVASAGQFSGMEKYVIWVSTLVTLSIAIEGVFDFRSKAMSYDLFLHELRLLRNQISYDYMQGDAYFKGKKNTHFEQLQRILGNTRSIIEASFDTKDANVSRETLPVIKNT